MADQGGDKVIGLMKLVIIVCAVVVLIMWVPGLIQERKWNAEREAKYKQWEENGISPVTRGQGVRDTLKIDTLNRIP